MKKLLVSLFILIPFCLYAEIKILNDVEWKPVIKSNWVSYDGLAYSNTVYGDTYYNSDYQDMKKANNIEYKTVYQYFNLKPDYKRTWVFDMKLSNLSAEKGFLYYSKDRPNKKQSADDIYWGITIGYKVNGTSRTTTIWIKRSYPDNNDYPHSGDRISYKVDNGSWMTTTGQTLYPSCEPGNAPDFSINSFDGGLTFMSWGDLIFDELPFYIDELSYISVMVGCQANVQIGKPSMSAPGGLAIGSPFLIKSGRYAEAKDELYKENGMYYEIDARDLARCYMNLLQFNKAIEICDALIKFNGKYIAEAYFTRGAAREVLGDYAGALDDYSKVGGEVGAQYYNNLYNRLYR